MEEEADAIQVLCLGRIPNLAAEKVEAKSKQQMYNELFWTKILKFYIYIFN